MGADVAYAFSIEGNEFLAEHPEEAQRAARAAASFREFANYWHFVNQDTGEDLILGEVLWPAQEEYIQATTKYPWFFALKARQLGETTIECAYDGWALRFRGGAKNARVHQFSKREKESQGLLARTKYGLERLPWWMQLPVEKDNLNEYYLNAGDEDTRKLHAYPADNDTARGETCTHAHIDEWAFMGNPARVWQAIEPSAAGTVHMLTTGMGPANWTSDFYLRCLAGDARDRKGNSIAPVFIDALKRPDRTEGWLAAKKKGMDEDTFRREYAMTWEDALSGGGEYVFKSGDIDACGRDFRALGPARKGRKYITGVDIGRHQDAAVIIVLDVTEDVHDIAHYRRLRGAPYPVIQKNIEEVSANYPGQIAIEKNAAGEAVLENVNVAEHRLLGFMTTKPSKARIIEQLKIAVQNQLIKWDSHACQQLTMEMRGYQIPDDGVVQDSVMALAIALEHASEAYAQGRIRSVMNV